MNHYGYAHGPPVSHNLASASGMAAFTDSTDGWQQTTHNNLMAYADATAVANNTPFFTPLMLSQIDGGSSSSRIEFTPDQTLMDGNMLLNSSLSNFNLNLRTQNGLASSFTSTHTSLLEETINMGNRDLMPQYPSTPASLQKIKPVQIHSPPVQNKGILSQINDSTMVAFTPDQSLMNGKMLLNSSLNNFDLNLRTQNGVANSPTPTRASLLEEKITRGNRDLMPVPQYPWTLASLEKNKPVQNHSPQMHNNLMLSHIDGGSTMAFSPDQYLMNGNKLLNLSLNLTPQNGLANNSIPAHTSLLEETINMGNRDLMPQYPSTTANLQKNKAVQIHSPVQNKVIHSQIDYGSRMAFAPDQSLMNGNMLLSSSLTNFDLNLKPENGLANNSTPTLTSLLVETINMGNKDLMPQYPSTPANLEKNKPVHNFSQPEFIDLVDDSSNDKRNWEAAWKSQASMAKQGNLCYLEPLATSPLAPTVPVSQGTALPFGAALVEQQQSYTEKVVSSAEAIDQTVNAATPDALENNGIDLNNTPRQKPKRKKHRPKVIREDKLARTPKPATPKPANPSGKRKYVRRNKPQVSVEAPSSVPGETSEPGSSNWKREGSPQKRAYVQKKKDENLPHGPSSNAGGTAESGSRCGNKSVRRRLDFKSDIPNTTNALAQNACCASNAIRIDAAASVYLNGVQQAAGNQVPEVPFGIYTSTKQVPNEHIRFAEKYSISHSQPCRTETMRTDHILDEIRSRKIPENPAEPPQPSKRENLKKLARKRFLSMDSSLKPDTIQLNSLEASNLLTKRRRTDHVLNNNAQIMMNENLMQEADRIEKHNKSAYLSQVYKKQGRDHEDVNALNTPSLMCMPSDGWLRCQITLDSAEAFTSDNVQNQQASKGMLEPDQPENIRVKRSCLALVPFSHTSVSSRVENNHITKHGYHSKQKAIEQNKRSDILQQISGNYIQASNNHEAIRCMETQVVRTTPRKDKSQTFMTNTNQVDLQGKRASSCNNVCRPRQKTTKATTLASRESREVSTTTSLNLGTLLPYGHPLSLNSGVSVPYQDSLDEVMHKLRHLTVNEPCKGEIAGAQNAIVPYSGDGPMVPYQGTFDLTKKRRPRAKVDLDPETNRVWNLLMGMESEGDQGTDADKEKWWEEERRVFRGRVDSFIARMHLVQGDRRFSKWKGSVVDSVVGVFLTQNVSDHLSSSAFMALAARFPRKTRCNNSGSGAEGRDLCIKNEDRSILILEGTRKWQEHISYQELHGSSDLVILENETANSNESFGSNSSVIEAKYLKNKCVDLKEKAMGISHDSPDSESSTQVTLTRSICIAEAEERWSVEDAGSSQNSSENPGQIGISSLSNRVEDLTIPTVCPGIDNSTSFTELLNSVLNVSDHIYLGFPERRKVNQFEKMRSSSEHTSIFSEIISPEAEFYPGNQYCSPSTLQPDLNEVPVAESLSQKCSLLSNSCTAKFQQEERVSRVQSTKQADQSQLQKQNFDNRHDPPNLHNVNPLETSEIIRLDFEDNAYISEKVSAEIPKGKTKGKKVKNENERNKIYDWDSMRKELELDGRKEERSQDAMDSVDWEAVRSAEVKEISQTIKERGMNNMLAERIKEFLNRLVRDHGSIDLEWIRKIEPGKAKDYLLSIRGLGLKSVECVRLLTLHHLAFPVDTNVGRICVRLGWVPLQPLPESLQLHLLELYPMLETIQKYLWPRLCKLDQRTLYELHYQLITFGKVFCTKSKPNCNACPMRGECKHFASAFASSRLKLTGPEEKSLVSSNMFIASEENHARLLNPTQHIYQLEGNSNLTGSVLENCEPIIEEPASPEAECIQIEEREIEDAFYEDPDEIPTIKLNIEEFTQNLQDFMQSNMEIQDVDMSKALVAINPEAASIPMPKLKNVSRLRTEHLVYELPDSHPLLEGFDPREPDDPSSYLLAIWTPGETAQSTEPPNEYCKSQETGAFCNMATCFACNSRREAQAQIVRGTILIPCRTAMRGSFPLNGTYFQVNELFADHDSSCNPIDVPREWIWNLPRRTVYFGTSVTSIFKGLNTEEIQFCFWRGFVCVRGFDRKTRAPRPLYARLHFPASKVTKSKQQEKGSPAKRKPNNTNHKDYIRP
ncbi:hypothetical protein Cni_G17365 [Canna indica]|uniref:HhH-GPD domain-containing protein n=1 Tax=Canna indica TaxID=4628 RepID=A0AAQ3KMA1_9LILI|nr:hypothetical protein Cni_G17365 [Canna indica]